MKWTWKICEKHFLQNMPCCMTLPLDMDCQDKLQIIPLKMKCSRRIHDHDKCGKAASTQERLMSFQNTNSVVQIAINTLFFTMEIVLWNVIIMVHYSYLNIVCFRPLRIFVLYGSIMRTQKNCWRCFIAFTKYNPRICSMAKRLYIVGMDGRGIHLDQSCHN